MLYAINSFDGVQFKGLYESKGTLKRETGHANIDKEVVKVYNFVYHPFEDETPEEIEKEIASNQFGRSFSIWEKDHAQSEGDYYYMNNIKIGDKIKRVDTDIFVKQDYSKIPLGVQSEEDFYDTFNNDSYATFDVKHLNKNDILRFVQKFTTR